MNYKNCHNRRARTSLREKQVNVRLNGHDSRCFEAVMKYYRHQTISDSIRDMVRTSFLKFSNFSKDDMRRVISRIPPDLNITREYQANVRFNEEEMEMVTVLISKMELKNTSDLIRSLIQVFYISIEDIKRKVVQ